MQHRARLTPMLAVVLLVLAGPLAPRRSSAQAGAPVAASAVAASGDFAGLVDIGGRRLYLECRDSGGPTVVLISG